jgi:hypothetical protein
MNLVKTISSTTEYKKNNREQLLCFLVESTHALGLQLTLNYTPSNA